MDFSQSIMELRYSWIKEDGTKETLQEIAERVVTNVLSVLPEKYKGLYEKELIRLISQRKFVPGGRFLAQSGRDYHQTNNCFLLRADDTREGWGELVQKSTVMLMSGGGIGVDYSDIRPKGAKLKRSGGESSGPIPLMKVINEIGRGVMAGGNRRSAIWAGLSWNHPDIFDFIDVKNWSQDVRKLKEKDFDFPATMDMTNVSVILDKPFFDAYQDENNLMHEHASKVYWSTIKQMLKTSEPGFSVNYDNPRESLRNACTEIVSEDDSDVCCLGSINLANIKDKEELAYVTDLATMFLLIGTEYSDSPTQKVKDVRNVNRRLGENLMGFHEWLIRHGYKYEENPELAEWLQTWKDESNNSAKKWADNFGFSTPKAVRSLAPNGSTAIAIGKTTGSLEPIFSLAYQRRYLTKEGWRKQYVVDFVAEKLHNEGYDLSTVEDAYSLSYDVERRISFQAFVQKYIDNSISSTVNLPEYGKPGNDNDEKFGNILMKYLPRLRGITTYSDGSRGGQPLTPVSFEFAIDKAGVVFEGNEECAGGICGF